MKVLVFIIIAAFVALIAAMMARDSDADTLTVSGPVTPKAAPVATTAAPLICVAPVIQVVQAPPPVAKPTAPATIVTPKVIVPCAPASAATSILTCAEIAAITAAGTKKAIGLASYGCKDAKALCGEGSTFAEFCTSAYDGGAGIDGGGGELLYLEQGY
jgi:hypothetical protein